MVNIGKWMKRQMKLPVLGKKHWIGLAVCGLLLGSIWVLDGQAQGDARKAVGPGQQKDEVKVDSSGAVSITDTQAKHVNVVPVELRDFVPQSDAVGYIDFNQDSTVQVFTPYQGRVRQVFAKAGDDVRKGQALFSIDSPDLVQAESNLLSSAGILALTSRALERIKKMAEVEAAAQKDLEQAISDQQSAEGNYKAARDAIRIFGKSEADIDKIIASRKVDGELLVASPIHGQVTARNVAPGLLLQPGNAPAPFTVADTSSMWMIAAVSEYDFPRLQVGQSVAISVMAYPNRKYNGQITNIGASIDANTHRIAVRSEIKDLRHELRPQMLATYTIRTGDSVRSVAVPAGGIVREGDGTMTVFVAEPGNRFVQRSVKLGQEQGAWVQILEGVGAGEKVAAEGALFLSNALSLQTR